MSNCGNYAYLKIEKPRLSYQQHVNNLVFPLNKPKSNVMRKNEPNNQLTFASFAKSITSALNSLFFNNSSRDFQRLKNFIAS
jgi:hypothetical protein